MAPFRFRLETLLKLRVAQRDERREALAKAVKADRILGERINDTDLEIEAARRRRLNQLDKGTLDVDGLLRGGSHEMVLRSDKASLENQRGRVLEEMEKRRTALMEADRQVKVLEKLKERRRDAHDHEAAKQEEKLLDELGTQRQLRRTRASNANSNA